MMTLRSKFTWIAASALVSAAAAAPLRTPPKLPRAVAVAAPWAGAWAYATSPGVETPRLMRPAGTFRYRLRLTQSGDAVTIRVSNPEEAMPFAIQSASVAVARDAQGFASDRATEATLAFAGHRDLKLAAAGYASSDPAPVRIKTGQDLIVTITTAASSTDVPGNAGFVSEFQPADGDATLSRSRPFVSMVSVRNQQAPCTIVTLGDSITEGARNVDTVHRGWPDRLADRLIARNAQSHCGVVNAGISGNRVLTYGRGAAAVDRFSRDVAAVPGVTHVILLEGINDITRSGQSGERTLTSVDLIAGYHAIITAAHARGLKVIAGTLTPGWGYRLATQDWENFRAETNRWIRTSGEFDGVIDFEAALGDNAKPPIMKAEYDSGDHLHPKDAGYQAMADAVPLTLFDNRSSQIPSISSKTRSR